MIIVYFVAALLAAVVALSLLNRDVRAQWADVGRNLADRWSERWLKLWFWPLRLLDSYLHEPLHSAGRPHWSRKPFTL